MSGYQIIGAITLIVWAGVLVWLATKWWLDRPYTCPDCGDPLPDIDGVPQGYGLADGRTVCERCAWQSADHASPSLRAHRTELTR